MTHYLHYLQNQEYLISGRKYGVFHICSTLCYYQKCRWLLRLRICKRGLFYFGGANNGVFWLLCGNAFTLNPTFFLSTTQNSTRQSGFFFVFGAFEILQQMMAYVLHSFRSFSEVLFSRWSLVLQKINSHQFSLNFTLKHYHRHQVASLMEENCSRRAPYHRESLQWR